MRGFVSCQPCSGGEPFAAGAVGVRMTPTEGAVRLAGLGCAVDMLPGFIDIHHSPVMKMIGSDGIDEEEEQEAEEAEEKNIFASMDHAAVYENAAEFENGTYKITYVANNGLTGDSAEADVVKPKLAGATYTVLNNSDSSLGFTAPDTKSFSKWNTKADGSGTDNAAAATYSTDADLKLYAVWA